MKKILLISLLAASAAIGRADLIDIEGVDILTDFYAHKMSLDGTQIVGEADDGSTVYYNIPDQQFYFYPECSFGRGYVVADNGWVVGCRMMDSDSQSTVGVIMNEGEISTPKVFDTYVTSNIHSITPDASRVCGVVGNNGKGMSNLPYYCDIDDNGNFGALQFLPVPDKDFFGNRPQYCSATWISKDGKTIAGQVVDARGFFIYPIVYRENEQGVWNYSFPSESLFNQKNLELPQPLGDFEEENPDLEYPDVTNFMDPSKVAAWNEAYHLWETNNFLDMYDPYNNLDNFMTEEEIEDYLQAVAAYNKAVEDYNEKNAEYWDKVFQIVECSVFFVRNGMAMSPDGNWLASSAEWEDTSSQLYDEAVMYYTPYRFDLKTGEIKQIDTNTSNVVAYQTFNNGDVISVSPTSSPMPPRSWLYQNSTGESISFADYVKKVSPFYGAWYEENLTGNIPVGEDDKGFLIYEYATITGNVAANEDMTVICGGVEGQAIRLDMLLTYIFTDLTAGIEKIENSEDFNGVYNVYDLKGVKVMTTRDASLLNSLPKGLYLINGKKIMK
ncbi:MAG: hypothetical protein J1E16_06010 [Muribaculaceae bacterium]|nr:hypothetical protein [Muribaculaceae bacterium]